MKDKFMAYAFLVLIVIFAGISAAYLLCNDFARETIEILFPAIGAILLSLYLGFKSIYLDAPKPENFAVSIAVLLDSGNGKISGMAPRSIEHPQGFNEFRGAYLLDTLPQYNVFKDKAFSETLSDTSNGPNSPAEALVDHFVEYALLEWLCNSDVSVGYIPGHRTQLISSSGGGGSVNGDLVETPISGGKNNPNPLLQASPLKIPLPKGSRIIRSDDHRLAFQIVTPHTTINFRISGGVMERIKRPVGEESNRIYSAIGLPDNVADLRMIGIGINITATQSPFSRYAKQAKIEKEWIDRLKEQINKDFSWDRLRALYANEQ